MNIPSSDCGKSPGTRLRGPRMGRNVVVAVLLVFSSVLVSPRPLPAAGDPGWNLVGGAYRRVPPSQGGVVSVAPLSWCTPSSGGLRFLPPPSGAACVVSTDTRNSCWGLAMSRSFDAGGGAWCWIGGNGRVSLVLEGGRALRISLPRRGGVVIGGPVRWLVPVPASSSAGGGKGGSRVASAVRRVEHPWWIVSWKPPLDGGESGPKASMHCWRLLRDAPSAISDPSDARRAPFSPLRSVEASSSGTADAPACVTVPAPASEEGGHALDSWGPWSPFPSSSPLVYAGPFRPGAAATLSMRADGAALPGVWDEGGRGWLTFWLQLHGSVPDGARLELRPEGGGRSVVLDHHVSTGEWIFVALPVTSSMLRDGCVRLRVGMSSGGKGVLPWLCIGGAALCRWPVPVAVLGGVDAAGTADAVLQLPSSRGAKEGCDFRPSVGIGGGFDSFTAFASGFREPILARLRVHARVSGPPWKIRPRIRFVSFGGEPLGPELRGCGEAWVPLSGCAGVRMKWYPSGLSPFSSPPSWAASLNASLEVEMLDLVACGGEDDAAAWSEPPLVRVPLPAGASCVVERSFTICPAGDRDRFILVPAGTGLLKLDFPAFPAALTGELRAWSDGGGGSPSKWTARKGGALSAALPVRADRPWLVEVRDVRAPGESWSSGESDWSTSPVRLKLALEPVPDPFEPNDSPRTAAAVPMSVTTAVYVFPAGDQDWFAVDIPEDRSGELTVDIEACPYPVAPSVEVVDAAGGRIGKVCGRAGHPVALRVQLRRGGRYLLHLWDGRGDNGPYWNENRDSSTRPVHLRVTFKPVLYSNEPNDSRGHAHVLRLGASLKGTIFPRGDHDWYCFTLPAGARGILSVDLKQVPEGISPYVRLFSPSGKKVLDVDAGRAGEPVRWVVEATEGGKWYLELHDGRADTPPTYWNEDRNSSTSPYVLQVDFKRVPSPEEPNDSKDAAFRIEPGAAAAFSIFPVGDVDWFACELEAGRLYRVRWDLPLCSVRPSLTLYDSSARRKAHWESAGSGVPLLAEFMPSESGVHLFELRDGKGENPPYWNADKDSSSAAMSLLVTPVAEPLPLAGTRIVEAAAVGGAPGEGRPVVHTFALPFSSSGTFRLHSSASGMLHVVVWPSAWGRWDTRVRVVLRRLGGNGEPGDKAAAAVGAGPVVLAVPCSEGGKWSVSVDAPAGGARYGKRAVRLSCAAFVLPGGGGGGTASGSSLELSGAGPSAFVVRGEEFALRCSGDSSWAVVMCPLKDAASGRESGALQGILLEGGREAASFSLRDGPLPWSGRPPLFVSGGGEVRLKANDGGGAEADRPILVLAARLWKGEQVEFHARSKRKSVRAEVRRFTPSQDGRGVVWEYTAPCDGVASLEAEAPEGGMFSCRFYELLRRGDDGKPWRKPRVLHLVCGGSEGAGNLESLVPPALMELHRVKWASLSKKGGDAAWSRLSGMLKECDVLVVDGADSSFPGFRPDRASELLEWVKAGGRLVFTDFTFADNLLFPRRRGRSPVDGGGSRGIMWLGAACDGRVDDCVRFSLIGDGAEDGARTPRIVFDLGSSRRIDRVRIWNTVGAQAVKRIRILAGDSSDSLGSVGEFLLQPGVAARTLRFEGVECSRIGIEVLSAWGPGASSADLAEVEIPAEPFSVFGAEVRRILAEQTLGWSALEASGGPASTRDPRSTLGWDHSWDIRSWFVPAGGDTGTAGGGRSLHWREVVRVPWGGDGCVLAEAVHGSGTVVLDGTHLWRQGGEAGKREWLACWLLGLPLRCLAALDRVCGEESCFVKRSSFALREGEICLGTVWTVEKTCLEPGAVRLTVEPVQDEILLNPLQARSIPPAGTATVSCRVLGDGASLQGGLGTDRDVLLSVDTGPTPFELAPSFEAVVRPADARPWRILVVRPPAVHFAPDEWFGKDSLLHVNVVSSSGRWWKRLSDAPDVLLFFRVRSPGLFRDPAAALRALDSFVRAGGRVVWYGAAGAPDVAWLASAVRTSSVGGTSPALLERLFDARYSLSYGGFHPEVDGGKLSVTFTLSPAARLDRVEGVLVPVKGKEIECAVYTGASAGSLSRAGSVSATSPSYFSLQLSGTSGALRLELGTDGGGIPKDAGLDELAFVVDPASLQELSGWREFVPVLDAPGSALAVPADLSVDADAVCTEVAGHPGSMKGVTVRGGLDAGALAAHGWTAAGRAETRFGDGGAWLAWRRVGRGLVLYDTCAVSSPSDRVRSSLATLCGVPPARSRRHVCAWSAEDSGRRRGFHALIPSFAGGEIRWKTTFRRGLSASSSAMRLELVTMPVELPFEPDDSRADAHPLPFEGRVSANLYPGGDVDCFSLYVPGPAKLDVTLSPVPEMVDPMVSVLRGGDAGPRDTFDGTCGGSCGAAEIFSVGFRAPDRIFLRIAEKNGRCSLEQYALRVSCTPVEAPFNPSRRLAFRLPSGAWAASAIYPKGDEDWFEVPLPPGGSWKQMTAEFDCSASGLDLNVGVFAAPSSAGGSAAASAPVEVGRTQGSRHFSLAITPAEISSAGGDPSAPALWLRVRSGSGASLNTYALRVSVGGPEAGRRRSRCSLAASFPPSGGDCIDPLWPVVLCFDSPLPAEVEPGFFRISPSVRGAAVECRRPAGVVVLRPPAGGWPCGGSFRVSWTGAEGAGGSFRGGSVSWNVRSRIFLGRGRPVSVVVSPSRVVAPGRTLAVKVLSREPLRALTLKVRGAGGAEREIPLASEDRVVWKGVLRVDASLGNGRAVFSVRGEDEQGREVSVIDEGKAFVVDAEPPAAPSGVRAFSRRAGGIELRWNAGAVAKDARTCVIERSSSPAGPFVEAARVDAGLGSFLDSPPRAGRWYYRLRAVDAAGNEGPWSAVVSGVSDTEPPSWIPRLTAEVAGSRVHLGLEPADSHDDAVSVRIQAVRLDSRAASDRVTFPSGPYDTWTLSKQKDAWYRLEDGAWYFRAASVDAAGNVSKYSPALRVVVDTVGPLASISVEGPSPLTSGSWPVSVSFDEPVSGTPVVSWRMWNDSAARSLPVTSVGGDRSRWKGTIVIDGRVQDGTALWNIEASDLHGNLLRGIAGGRTFSVDTTPPFVRIKSEPPGRFKRGKVRFSFVFNEKLASPPEIRLFVGDAEMKLPQPVRAGGLVWRVDVSFDGEYDRVPARFDVRAVDLFGHEGGRIVEGGSFVVDTVPPAPPMGLKASSAPGGKVVLSWLPPASEPVERYEVHRARIADFERSESTKAGVVSECRFEDKPSGGEVWWYRVASVDAAGNVGPLSQAVRAAADTTPPEPCGEVACTVRDGGMVYVAWKPSPSPDVESYEVRCGGRIVEPAVPASRRDARGMCFSRDVPGSSGRLVYAVRAVDRAGNKSKPSFSASLSYDVTPPSASVTVIPAVGEGYLRRGRYGVFGWNGGRVGLLRPGRHEVVLECDEPLSSPPVLGWRLGAAGSVSRIPLASRTADVSGANGGGAGPSRWRGTLEVPAGIQDVVVFSFSGVDSHGNEGGTIRRGRVWFADDRPPAPPAGVRVESLPGGAVRIEWSRMDSEPVQGLKWRIWRRTAGSASSAPPAAVVAELDEWKSSFEARPPADGIWSYAVASVDACGNSTAPTLWCTVTVDSSPPPPPSGVKAAFAAGHGLRVSWKPVEGACAYEVFARAAASGGASDKGRRRLTTTSLNGAELDVPFRRPFRVGVCSLDEVGNRSGIAWSKPLDPAGKVPVARLSFAPPPPWRRSGVVELSVKPPLREAPELVLVDSWGKLYSLFVQPADGTGMRWKAVVDAAGLELPDGECRFRFKGVSRDGLSGDFIDGEAVVRVDTRPPSLELSLSGRDGGRSAPGGGGRLSAGRWAVRLESSERLAGGPLLWASMPDGTRRRVDLEPLGPDATRSGTGRVWRGVLEIRASDTPGVGRWMVEARDEAGNVSDSVEPACFEVDVDPPSPPSSVTACGGARGSVKVCWNVPLWKKKRVEPLAGYAVYRSQQPFVHTSAALRIAPLVKGLEYADRGVPSDGLWYYGVCAVDLAGNESTPVVTSCTADRTPPAAPAAVVKSDDGARVVLEWNAVEDPSSPVSYQVWWRKLDGHGAFDSMRKLGDTTRTIFEHVPPSGGRLVYVVRAVDGAGNLGPMSVPVVEEFVQRAPSAVIRTNPPGTLAPGRVEVRLETSLALVELPLLKVESRDGEHGAVRWSAEVPVREVEGCGMRVFSGAFDLPPGCGDRVCFSFRGSSEHGGRRYTGSTIVEGGEAPVDTVGPLVRISLAGGGPMARRDRLAVVGAGEWTVEVAFDEPPASDPSLSLEAAGGTTVPIPLVRRNALEYLGCLSLEPGGKVPEGRALFVVSARDAAGNPVSAIRGVEALSVDYSAPPAPRQFRAVSLPGGKVRVEWTAPVGRDGAPLEDVVGFHVYRNSEPFVSTEGMSPVGRTGRILGWFDHPGGGVWYYAVRAVDEAGNEGPQAGPVKVSVDAEPPSPPRNVKCAVREDGVVCLSWEPPDGEKPIYYNVYMEKNPIVSTAGLAPRNPSVPWTRIYGTPNEDGRYYFVVTAVDAHLNESAPSECVSLDYRRIPPIASFRLIFRPEAGRRPGGEGRPSASPYPWKRGEPVVWLRRGRYEVRLSTTKPLVEAPHVRVKSEHGRCFSLPFTGASTSWRSELVVDDSFEEGTYGFLFVGVSSGGVKGDETAEGPLFHVDVTPPPPPELRKIEADPDLEGGVVLRWNSPKSDEKAVEVPHFYEVLRRRAGADDASAVAAGVVKVEYENLDEYVFRDVPPCEGAWEYAVVSLDLAGNRSVPSQWRRFESRRGLPRAALFVCDETGVPLQRVGRRSYDVYLFGSSAVVAPVLSWAVVGTEERLGRRKERWHEVPLSACASSAVPAGVRKAAEVLGYPASTGKGAAIFRGRVDFSDRPADVEEEARLKVEQQGAAVRLTRGDTVLIDGYPPEAEIVIDDCYRMKVDAAAGKLVVPPIGPGAHVVRIDTREPLRSAPSLVFFTTGSDVPHPVPMKGFGAVWSGSLVIGPHMPEGEARFEWRGVDLAGNVGTRIRPRRYPYDVDDTVYPPRKTANYATTGGRFTIDVTPPPAPQGLTAEARKLGVAVLRWKEVEGDVHSYRLYRSRRPIASVKGLKPVKTDLFSPVAVDDPPCDGNYFYVVTAVDFAGNESPPSSCASVFIDTIKKELKIRAVPSGDDFVILMDEEPPGPISVTLNFPGRKSMQVRLGGDSGALKRLPRSRTGGEGVGFVLPQKVEVFNGRVEIVVHSPDPEGNVVETVVPVAGTKITTATGGVVESFDGDVALEVPPGVEPVIPKGPGEVKRVGGYENLFFITYANIPERSSSGSTPAASGSTQAGGGMEPEPLPPGLEVVGKPYRIELNADTEEPIQLAGCATQASGIGKLKELAARIRMKIPTLHSDAVADVDYLKSRLKVVKWVPALKDEDGKVTRKGRWEFVPDVEIDVSKGELVAPAKDVTTYVVVSEQTPPSIVDPRPEPGSVCNDSRPLIGARIVDKGTGVAVGAENRIWLTVDGRAVPEAELVVGQEDPTEVPVEWRPSEPLAPGEHLVVLRAEDVVENKAVRKWRFVISHRPPRVEAMAPREREVVGVRRPVVAFRLDALPGTVDARGISLMIDGRRVPGGMVRFDPADGSVVYAPSRPLVGGPHAAEAAVTDRWGKKAFLSTGFAVDTSGPVLLDAAAVLEEPSSGDGAQPVPVRRVLAVVKDDCAGVDHAGMLVMLDGAECAPASVSGSAGTTCVWKWNPAAGLLEVTVPAGLTPGAHTLSLAVRDALGNETVSSRTFVVDGRQVHARPAELPASSSPRLRSGAAALFRLSGWSCGERVMVEFDGPHGGVEALTDPLAGRFLLVKKESGEGAGAHVASALRVLVGDGSSAEALTLDPLTLAPSGAEPTAFEPLLLAWCRRSPVPGWKGASSFRIGGVARRSCGAGAAAASGGAAKEWRFFDRAVVLLPGFGPSVFGVPLMLWLVILMGFVFVYSLCPGRRRP